MEGLGISGFEGFLHGTFQGLGISSFTVSFRRSIFRGLGFLGLRDPV